MKELFLLSDEVSIDDKDFKERQVLIEEFSKMPEDFFSKLRHFQPQIGCLNGCKICSKFAGARVEFWTERRIRNIIAALKYSSPQTNTKKARITYDRSEHRSNVIFPYLDNDIGNYPYLKEFIDTAYKELGVTTRISSVGYSRYNEELNTMHKKINKSSKKGLGGVRLSFTPYEIGWTEENEAYSRFDYVMDMANFLSIYKPYYEGTGSGYRKMCVELRYKPLVVRADVYVTEVLGHKVICTKNYLWISRNESVEFQEAKIKDPQDHSIVLTEHPELFHTIDLYEDIESLESLKKISHKFIIGNLDSYELSEVYMLKNYDGEYYAFNPSIRENGNFGINVYPITESRNVSGYIITERFALNTIIKYKVSKNLGRKDEFPEATWQDVYNVITMCKKDGANYSQKGKEEKYEYIVNEVVPMLNAYASCLQMAGFKPKDFFDRRFSIDTGIICNLGRAITEFKGLTNKTDEPLTPSHERNYGSFNSKMTQEGVSWRLSCDYGNSIVIEKLNMYDTSSERGQVGYKKTIHLDNAIDEVYTNEDLKAMYLIPGQRAI